MRDKEILGSLIEKRDKLQKKINGLNITINLYQEEQKMQNNQALPTESKKQENNTRNSSETKMKLVDKIIDIVTQSKGNGIIRKDIIDKLREDGYDNDLNTIRPTIVRLCQSNRVIKDETTELMYAPEYYDNNNDDDDLFNNGL